MNSITQALKDANIKLPSVRYRVFMWLKDHPEKTAEDIQKALGLDYPPSKVLRDLVAENAVKVYRDKSRHTNSITKSNCRVSRFTVIVRSIDTERRIPVRKKKLVAPVVTPMVPVVVVAPAPVAHVTVVKQKAEFDPEEFTKSLKLTQVKALYVYLHEVFK